MHRIGLLHLDIKTCNILVGDQDLLLLCDFGMARMINCEGIVHRRGHTITTLTHRSPELMLGHRVLGEWNDLWSVGMVLFQCA
jgi:serine/threonine protein kinase